MAAERRAILCVDDEPDLLDALRSQLRQGLGGSYLIETAQDGEEGEEVFDELLADGYKVPVVIADYIMPRLKGDELLRRIHAVSPECRKILLTGHATPEAVGNAVRYAGLYRYLAKPLDMQDLLLTVDEALGSWLQATKLARFHQSLEARIEVRTKELAEKNQELLREIAERRRVEADLIEARDTAEAATRAKSVFLASISHDLRTPLNSVLGYAELLGSAVSEQQQRDYAGSIGTAGKALLTLIDDLLDLSRADAGKLRLEFAAVSVTELLHELPGLCGISLSDKALDVRIQVVPELPAALLLDRARLRQVLYNLMANAVKFTDSGFISLAADCPVNGNANADSDADEADRVDLRVVVRDSGVGIPAEQLESIFEPFEQRPGQSVERYGGTGLGLTICRRLVDAMGGQLTVESTPGEGSAFTVLLPNCQVVAAPAAVEDDAAVAGYRFAPARLLVVDDISTNRQLLCELLRPYGFELHEAEDGRQALTVAATVQPDLVLMDINMPVMDGFAATRELNAGDRAAPVLAVTASTELSADDPAAALFAGILTKPLGLGQLLPALARHLPFSVDDVDAVVVAERKDGPLPTGLAEALRSMRLDEISGAGRYPSINKLTDLATELQRLGREHGHAGVLEQGAALQRAVARFDMSSVGRVLSRLAGLAETVQPPAARPVVDD